MRLSTIIIIITVLISNLFAGENSIYGVLWTQSQKTNISTWVISDVLTKESNANAFIGYHFKFNEGFWIEPLIGGNLEAEKITEAVAFKSYYTGIDYIHVWFEGGLTDFSKGFDGNWNLFGMYHTPIGDFGKVGLETIYNADGITWGAHWVISLRNEFTLVPHLQEGGRFVLDLFFSL